MDIFSNFLISSFVIICKAKEERIYLIPVVKEANFEALFTIFFDSREYFTILGPLFQPRITLLY